MMFNMKKSILIMILAIGLLAGCGDQYVDDDQAEYIDYTVLMEKKLYYIPHEMGKNDFPRKYKVFLAENKDLEVIDVEASADDDSHNTTNGYFVFTKEK